jgi:hypothetical protein
MVRAVGGNSGCVQPHANNQPTNHSSVRNNLQRPAFHRIEFRQVPSLAMAHGYTSQQLQLGKTKSFERKSLAVKSARGVRHLTLHNSYHLSYVTTWRPYSLELASCLAICNQKPIVANYLPSWAFEVRIEIIVDTTSSVEQFDLASYQLICSSRRNR